LLSPQIQEQVEAKKAELARKKAEYDQAQKDLEPLKVRCLQKLWRSRLLPAPVRWSGMYVQCGLQWLCHDVHNHGVHGSR